MVQCERVLVTNTSSHSWLFLRCWLQKFVLHVLLGSSCRAETPFVPQLLVGNAELAFISSQLTWCSDRLWAGEVCGNLNFHKGCALWAELVSPVFLEEVVKMFPGRAFWFEQAPSLLPSFSTYHSSWLPSDPHLCKIPGFCLLPVVTPQISSVGAVVVAAGRVAQGNRSHFSVSARSGKEEEESFHQSVSCSCAAWVPLPSPVANRAVLSAGPAASYSRDQGFISVFFMHSLRDKCCLTRRQQWCCCVWMGGVAGRRKMGSVVVDPICIDLNAKGIFL